MLFTIHNIDNEMMANRISNKEKAQSLTELAISFTFLMLLLAGSVDLGRIFFTMIQLQDAAQEGAIYGSSDPTNTTEIKARVRATASNPIDLTNTSTVDVEVNPVPSGSALCAGTAQFISLAIPSNSIPLTGSATSTILTPPCP